MTRLPESHGTGSNGETIPRPYPDSEEAQCPAHAVLPVEMGHMNKCPKVPGSVGLAGSWNLGLEVIVFPVGPCVYFPFALPRYLQTLITVLQP